MSDIQEFFHHVNQLSPMSVYLGEAKPGERHGILDCALELDAVTRTSYPTLHTSIEVNQYALGDILYAHQIADILVERWNSHTREIDAAT
jgi:hypothetical protein